MTLSPAPPWQIWIDTGGTFTDCLARDPAGALRRAKVLSSACLRGTVRERRGERRLVVGGLGALPAGGLPGWTLRALGGEAAVPALGWDGTELTLGAAAPRGLVAGAPCELASPEEAPVLACRLVTGTAADAPLPPLRLRLATTLGTNALLERRGAPTALFLTRGFGDLLAIGTQQRPELFALAVVKPPPLHALVVEVVERTANDGTILVELELEGARQAAAAARAQGITAAAVALLHSFRHPRTELRLADALRQLGFEHVSASAELAPVQGYLTRAETTLVNAYLAPILEGYLRRIAAASPVVLVMTSAGGLVAAERFRPYEGLLSGPAAGVVGAAEAARRSGLQRAVTFDMGGTSTDVARWDGALPWVFEHHVGEARLLAPAVAVETVAAGGGSICSFDGRRLRVGPESGGARPGPACYGAGGPLCVTDVNLLLGRLEPARFEIPLDAAASERACAALEATLVAAGEALPREELLAGLLQIANERMAEAIREISVRQGYDPAAYALLAFGGAGGQHACAVAELLGIDTVAVPADAGLLSALGLGVARIERVASRQVLQPLAAAAPLLAGWLGELAAAASAEVAAQGAAAGEVVVERRLLELRYAGQESTVEVPWADGDDVAAAFAARYRELFGYVPAARPVEVVTLRVAAAAQP
ncbi:MAG TPA: hydantoinase/oxoprolinase family protein, partial [Thermoanaerobaculia bacterium]|nr:hydantoinase/oxoprolinase family protein [Thermoanaerobaculia bacterium]